MASQNKTLQLMATKLGLADEDKVIRKAGEFERLLQTKTTAGSNLSDTSKVVICLDLAAFMLGADLDTKTAIKFSGLKPSTYTNSRKVVENLLELSSNKLSVAAACVKLQCTGIQTLAENILEEYQKQAKMEIDLNLPQYVCMAVHQACRLNKVKVSKAKLLETSRLKPAQWAKLEADWSKFADDNFAAVKKKRGRPAKNVVNDEMEVDQPPKEVLLSEPETESYEDWKKRILETAYKELREMQELQKQIKSQKVEKMEEDRHSPRKHSISRSPRKNSHSTSRKSQDSPRKVLFSPNKDVSVQLSDHLTVDKIKEVRKSPRKRSLSRSSKDSQLMSRKSQGSPRKVLFSPNKNVSGQPSQYLTVEKMEEDRKSPRKHTPSRSRKNSQLLSRKSQSSPKKVLFSPNKDVSTHIIDYLTVEKIEGDRKSPRKRAPSGSKRDSQLIPRKSQDSPIKDLFSPNKNVSAEISQHLSSRKLSQGLKENNLSPRKDPIASPMEEDSPRRSPRKTPQKFSPYKTPTPKNGIRLLFPKNL